MTKSSSTNKAKVSVKYLWNWVSVCTLCHFGQKEKEKTKQGRPTEGKTAQSLKNLPHTIQSACLQTAEAQHKSRSTSKVHIQNRTPHGQKDLTIGEYKFPYNPKGFTDEAHVLHLKFLIMKPVLCCFQYQKFQVHGGVL
jgi:hypothetical protein